MELLLGMDLGTSYYKVALFDRRGKLCGLGRVATPTCAEGEGIREVPVAAFWSALLEALHSALHQAHAEASDLRGACYSSQANTFLLLDEAFAPLTPLVVWTDTRAPIDPAVRELWNREDFSRTTGVGTHVGPVLFINKAIWFRRNRPDLWRRVRHIMTISDFLTFSLTGAPVGDGGTASLTGLCNPTTVDWWDEALQAVAWKRSFLSRPYRPGTTIGSTTRQAENRLSLPAGIVFVAGGLDHHLAALGAGLGSIAPLSDSTGTVLACVHRCDTSRPTSQGCVGPDVGSGFYQLAFDGNGAGVLEWYQRRYAPDIAFPELIAAAADVPIGADGLIALPSAHTRADLSGFLGPGSLPRTPGRCVRAILESIVVSLDRLVETLCPERRPPRIVATGGGARSETWLQLKADLLGIEFVTTDCPEPACRGAAMLAAVAAGWYPSLDDVSQAWTRLRATFRPDAQRHQHYARLLEKRRTK